MLVRATARGSSDPYYDLFGDWDLIVSSFLSQYGIRLRTKEFETVTWDEFRSLLVGLAPDTALGRIVAIRSETDKNTIKHFSKDQKRVYDEWRNHGAEIMSRETYDQAMKTFENMFQNMSK